MGKNRDDKALLECIDLAPNAKVLICGTVSYETIGYVSDVAGKVDVEKPSDTYDCIIVFEDESFDLDAIKELKNHLEKDGKLVLAVNNPESLRYLLGIADENSGEVYWNQIEGKKTRLIKETINAALKEAGFANPFYFYPMPDRYFPNEIFSDARFPEEGELIGVGRDYVKNNPYSTVDEQELYNRILRAGEFEKWASAFYVICSNDGAPKTGTLYAKYNRNRRKSYQTITKICCDANKKWIEKKPLDKEARTHVLSFGKKYEMARSIYTKIESLPCKIEGETVKYDFVKGTYLTDLLLPYKNNFDEFVSQIKKIYDEYFTLNADVECEFVKTPEYMQLFGDADCSNFTCIRPVNLDMIFDNVALTEDGRMVAFDYEWTFDVAVPKQFVYYRILRHLYAKFSECIANEVQFYNLCGISAEEVTLFSKMEESFRKNIFGDFNEARAFSSKRPTVADVMNTSTQQLLNKIEDLQAKVEDYEIEKELTAQHLLKIEWMEESRSWKMTKGLRKLAAAKRLRIEKGWKALFEACYVKVLHRVNGYTNDYDHRYKKEVLAIQRKTNFAVEKKISVLVRLKKNGSKETLLDETIKSVKEQTYKNYEIVVLDADNKKNLEEQLKGDYICFLEEGDLLHSAALYEMMCEIESGADFVYTDEVDFEQDLNHVDVPFYKPDFAPDELRSRNYIGHLCAIEKDLLFDIQDVETYVTDKNDYALVLKTTKNAKKIAHIAKILYYHRKCEALNDFERAQSDITTLNEEYKADGLSVTTEQIRAGLPYYRIKTPNHTERIHVVIWAGDNEDKIRRTINSVRYFWSNPIRLTIVGNQTYDTLREEYLDQWYGIYVYQGEELRAPDIKKIINNSDEEYFLFIKAGMEFVSERPIDRMLDYASLDGVAAVDSKVLYHGGRIFSAGLVISKTNASSVALRGHNQYEHYEGYKNAYIHPRNVSAVCGLCTMVAKTDWLKLPVPYSLLASPFVAQSMHAAEPGVRLVWLGDVKAYDNLLSYYRRFEGYRYDERDIPKQELFLNENILQYGLEHTS